MSDNVAQTAISAYCVNSAGDIEKIVLRYYYTDEGVYVLIGNDTKARLFRGSLYTFFQHREYFFTEGEAKCVRHSQIMQERERLLRVMKRCTDQLTAQDSILAKLEIRQP